MATSQAEGIATEGRTGDAGAFATHVYASHDASLRRYFARRGVRRDDVDDLIQDVYLRLMRRPESDGIQCTRAFVFTTAANLLRDDYRRRRVRGTAPAADVDSLDLPAEGEDPERSAAAVQHLEAMQDTIRTLKPATRRVFLGHRLNGESYAELAHLLGVSVSMVEKHMIAAISALGPLSRECLG